MRRWDAPAPLPDDVPRLTAWVEAATGLELDERGSIRCSTAPRGWRARLKNTVIAVLANDQSVQIWESWASCVFDPIAVP